MSSPIQSSTALIFQEAVTGPIGFLLHHYEDRLDDILSEVVDEVRIVCDVDVQV